MHTIYQGSETQSLVARRQIGVDIDKSFIARMERSSNSGRSTSTYCTPLKKIMPNSRRRRWELQPILFIRGGSEMLKSCPILVAGGGDELLCSNFFTRLLWAMRQGTLVCCNWVFLKLLKLICWLSRKFVSREVKLFYAEAESWIYSNPWEARREWENGWVDPYVGDQSTSGTGEHYHSFKKEHSEERKRRRKKLREKKIGRERQRRRGNLTSWKMVGSSSRDDCPDRFRLVRF